MSASDIKTKLEILTEGVSGFTTGSDDSWMPDQPEIKDFIITSWEKVVGIIFNVNPGLLDNISTVNTDHWVFQSPYDTWTFTVDNFDPIVIIEITTTVGNAKYKAKKILSESEFARGLDTNSYHYAGTDSPVWYQAGGVVKILPPDATPAIRYVQSINPANVVFSQTSFNSWMAAGAFIPHHIERLTLLYTAILMLKWSMTHIMSKMPTDLGTLASGDYTAFDVEANIDEVSTILDVAINTALMPGDAGNATDVTTGSIDLSMSPIVDSLDIWTNASDTGVFDQIDTNEDIELAAAKMQAISSRLGYITSGFQNYVTRLGAKQTESQSNIAKNSAWYSARVQEINTRVQQISALIQGHEQEIQVLISTLGGSGPVKTFRNNEATKGSG
tara:strand:- start:7185 stop:8348 length:1164 start_codon:yes stop_codon:yes gene_type:complete